MENKDKEVKSTIDEIQKLQHHNNIFLKTAFILSVVFLFYTLKMVIQTLDKDWMAMFVFVSFITFVMSFLVAVTSANEAHIDFDPVVIKSCSTAVSNIKQKSKEISKKAKDNIETVSETKDEKKSGNIIDEISKKSIISLAMLKKSIVNGTKNFKNSIKPEDKKTEEEKKEDIKIETVVLSPSPVTEEIKEEKKIAEKEVFDKLPSVEQAKESDKKNKSINKKTISMAELNELIQHELEVSSKEIKLKEDTDVKEIAEVSKTVSADSDIKKFSEETSAAKKNSSRNKKELIAEWRKKNPKGTKTACSKETGCSPSTVRKWWDYQGEV